MRFKITALSLQICFLICLIFGVLIYAFSGSAPKAPIDDENAPHMHDKYQLVSRRDAKRTKILEMFKMPKERRASEVPEHLPNFLAEAVTVPNPAGELPEPSTESPFSIVIVSFNEPLLGKTVDEVLAVESQQLITEVCCLRFTACVSVGIRTFLQVLVYRFTCCL